MSLILCRQEPVTSPYFVEELGVHLWSSQELCYVIYHNPLLVMEGFVNHNLTAFIRSQLCMPFLAEKLEKWMDGRGASDELLFLILQDCWYYTAQEQAAYRQQVTALRKLPWEEYAKRRANYEYSLKLYGRAIASYEKILEKGKELPLSAGFKASVWNNIAACYARLFCYQKAAWAYECAYNEAPDRELIRRLFELTRMEPELELKERFADQIDDEEKNLWSEEADGIREQMAGKEAVTLLMKVFEKDPVKRLDGASELINRWKLEYRKMI